MDDGEQTVTLRSTMRFVRSWLRRRFGASIAASVAPRRITRAALPVWSRYATAAALLLEAGTGGGALVEDAAVVRQAAHNRAVFGWEKRSG